MSKEGVSMINEILLSFFILIILHNNIKIFYLSKKDNYRNDKYPLESNNNKIMKFLNIALLILVFFYKNFKYRQIALVIGYIDFFLIDFYIQYKHSKRTKKTGQLIPYAIVIIFFTIVLMVNFFESNS